MANKNNPEQGQTRYVVLQQAVVQTCPQFYRLVGRNPEDFKDFRIYQRNPGDFLAVLKRYGDDGSSQVIFGSGSDFVSALLSIEGSLAADRWRVETPPPWDKK